MKKPYLIAVVVGLLLAGVLLLFLFGPFPGSKAPDNPKPSLSNAPPQSNLEQIVTNYRKIIVLLENEESLDKPMRDDAAIIAKYLFYENAKLLGVLSNQLSADIDSAVKGGFLTTPPQIQSFLDELEKSSEWRDADKLAFREIVDALADTLQNTSGEQKAKKALQTRLGDDLNALHEIKTLYDKELEKIFGRFETRGMVVRREKWEHYVDYLKTKFNRTQILQEYHSVLPEKVNLKTSGQKKPLSGFEFPQKTLVLTFDDGPHRKYTQRIHEILKQHDVKAIFFQVGQNLGTLKDGEKAKPSRLFSISQQLKDSGQTLANHSFTHANFTKLDDKTMNTEIDKTNTLIHSITKTSGALFRPPYGAQNDKLMAELEKQKMKSVLWNIDSRDWADPIPASIANRVVRTVAEQKKGIILFHDIHERTVEALPLILETLKKEGYTFLAWNGQEFVSEKPQNITAQAATQPSALYRESWAVIIGIDNYQQWPKLQYAVNDARAMRDILIKKYRFKAENIQLILNEAATREQILSVLGDTMGNAEKVKKDDRVFIFFAGHGATRKLSSGRYLGYIVPVNADLQNYQGQSISMTNFQDISEAIPAKHVFFVMDSCYSGLGLTRSGGAQANSANYLREVARRNSRQMLTAGGMDEQVADNGPNGHSVFTWTLLQGLEGKADLNGDGFITASELAAYLGPGVSAISKQTPSFGNLPGSEGGEFIFDPKQDNEFLSELSTQLDEEAIHLNSQLETIRKQIAEKKMRNEKLRKELSAAQTQIDGKNGQQQNSAADNTRLKTAKHMEQGNALFKEKKYNEALAEFLAANKLNPSNALAANNIGYVYFKMEQYDQAVQWFEKTIALDPRRSIAYANIGEAYIKLNRKSDAKKALTKYIELAPNTRYAAEISTKLKTLD